MATIKCPRCGSKVSDMADICPICDFPLKKSNTSSNNKINTTAWNTSSNRQSINDKKPKKKHHLFRDFVIALVLVILLFAWIGKDNNNDDEKTQSATSITPATTEKAIKQTASKKVKNAQVKKHSATKNIKKHKAKATPKPKDTKKIFIKSCKKYPYKAVLRNPNKYIGKKIKVKLKISSVHDKGLLTPTKYYFAYSKDKYGWFGNEYGIFDTRKNEKPKLLEDDIIEVYGTIRKPEETKSLIVNSKEVFTINMKYAKLIHG